MRNMSKKRSGVLGFIEAGIESSANLMRVVRKDEDGLT